MTMMIQSAMREAHVRTIRTGNGSTRACPCCADFTHNQKATRRAQRRREARAWRREADRD